MLARRALVLEVGAIVVVAAVWIFGFWLPGRNHRHEAVRAFDAYAARLPASWHPGAASVDSEHAGDSYLVCSKRSDASAGVQHLCLTVRIDRPEGKQVTGGYRIKSVGFDLPQGEKYACFGDDRGECIEGDG